MTGNLSGRSGLHTAACLARRLRLPDDEDVPSRSRSTAKSATVLASIVLAAGCAASAGGVPAPENLDGWHIGPAITCAALPSLDADRCDGLTRRAVAYAVSTGSPVDTWTMHAAEPVDAAGSRVLYLSGAGMPDAIILVHQSDGFHAVPMGCFQPSAPGASIDPSCP